MTNLSRVIRRFVERCHVGFFRRLRMERAELFHADCDLGMESLLWARGVVLSRCFPHILSGAEMPAPVPSATAPITDTEGTDTISPQTSFCITANTSSLTATTTSTAIRNRNRNRKQLQLPL